MTECLEGSPHNTDACGSCASTLRSGVSMSRDRISIRADGRGPESARQGPDSSACVEQLALAQRCSVNIFLAKHMKRKRQFLSGEY